MLGLLRPLVSRRIFNGGLIRNQGQFRSFASFSNNQVGYKSIFCIELGGTNGLGEMLKTYGTDLTELAQAGRLDPVIGREEEIRRTLQMY